MITAFAPASVSNLGPGFDVLGLAVDGPGDTVAVERSATPGVRIVEIHGDGGVLPMDPTANTAAIAATATLALAGADIGVSLILTKGMPIGSGLGSSAASAVAAAVATHALIGAPMSREALVGPCLQAEAAVSGRHADNVAPSLLGGLILVRRTDPLHVIRLPIPEGLWVTVVTPDLSLSTRAAREVLPDRVPLGAMVQTAADLGSLVHACHTGDLDLLAASLVDEVVAPRRAALIPGCHEVIAAALGAGALGSTVSGAGPSVFAFARSATDADRIAAAMAAGFASAGLGSRATVSPASCRGARVT